MSQKHWYVYLHGETLGPVGATFVTALIKESRLHFTDFVWCEGLENWTRLTEVEPFSKLMPPPPSAELPRTGIAHKPVAPTKTTPTMTEAPIATSTRHRPTHEPQQVHAAVEGSTARKLDYHQHHEPEH